MASNPMEGNVSNSRFMFGLLQTLDIGANLAQAITISTDISRANAILKQCNNQATLILPATQELVTIGKQNGYKILQNALAALKDNLPVMNQYANDESAQASGGFRMTANMMTLNAKYYSEIEHLDVFTQCLSDIPESYLKAQVIRWYNQAFGIAYPKEVDAYMLAINGFWAWSDFIAQYQTEQGLDVNDAKNVATIRNWQIGVPSLHDAWVMVQRGLWLKSDWYNLAQLGLGFTKPDADAMFSLFGYDPSIGDVMGLASLIPLDPLWINQKLTRSGMSTADIAIFTSAITKSTVLREVRAAWSAILSTYVYGMFTDDELQTYLESWQFPSAEINIKMQTAQIQKQKTVNSLMRDADIYLYRAGTITEGGNPPTDTDGLFDRLLAMDIPEDVANAITRNEACKKGIDWELPAP